MKKRVSMALSLLLVFVMVFSLMPTQALAAPPSSYSENGITVSVTPIGINVPYSIVYMGDGVFYGYTNTGGIWNVSSQKDIPYYLFDLDGNMTWQYDASVDLGETFNDGLCKKLMFDPYTGIEKWGYIDKYGNEVIKGQFDVAEDFSDGYAAVKIGDSWGYINTSGETVIPCDLKNAGNFGDGYAWVTTSDNWTGYIDKSGNRVFECPKIWVDSVGGGKVQVYGYNEVRTFRDGHAFLSGPVDENGDSVYIIDTGWEMKTIPGLSYSGGTKNMAGVYDSGRIPVVAGGFFGAVDTDGNLVIPFIYDKLYDFSNGVAPARKDGMWGLIDVDGNTIVPFEWSFMWEFDGDQVIAKHSSDGRFYILEPNGSPAAEPDEPELPAQNEPSSWAQAEVERAVEAGIVPENLRGAYTQAATRAEFCALAVGLYETVTGEEITERAEFTDTTDVNVQKMAGLGIVNGMGEGRFEPDSPLTREQAAALLSRLADSIGKPLAASAPSFADNGSISGWAKDAVGQMQASGVMGGVGSNTFDPSGTYTREQSMITMLRMYEIVK